MINCFISATGTYPNSVWPDESRSELHNTGLTWQRSVPNFQVYTYLAPAASSVLADSSVLTCHCPLVFGIPKVLGKHACHSSFNRENIAISWISLKYGNLALLHINP